MVEVKRIDFIAEFCQNHNGDFQILARMVEAAARAGATHGKIQAIYASDLAYRPQFEQGLLVDGITKAICRPYQAEYDRLQSLELSAREMRLFVSICKEHGLVPMVTVFTRQQLEWVAELGFEEVKVASYDCASYSLLRELATHFSRVTLSTGATFDDELVYAVRQLSGTVLTLLHCVTLYPTPLSEMHLNRMEYLRGLASRVGLSDHSLVAEHGTLAAKAALCLGADIIERHFTILGPTDTKDGPVSIQESHLADLVRFSQLPLQEQEEELLKQDPNWRRMCGTAQRELSDEELLNRDYYRGRFASSRPSSRGGRRMIYNWEETPVREDSGV